MTHYLFPVRNVEASASFKRGHYITIFTDISRASRDAIEALFLFFTLVEDLDRGPECSRPMVYNAYCGDTSCHLCAGIMKEFFSFSKLHPSSYSQWLRPTVERLVTIHNKIMETSAQLTCKGAYPAGFGLSDRRETAQNILKAWDWSEEHLRTLNDIDTSPC